ncbi:MAG: hypothetical protein IJ047_02945 [Paludibacteraceae bacterium]|nr:hypothetical protein [Paludibacteraceae bacterium]
MRKMKIILTGATGYVGEGVMLELLRTPQVEKVLSVGRRPVRIDDYPLSESEKAKLEEYIIPDFMDLKAGDKHFEGYDAVYFIAGITSIGTPENVYRRISYDIPTHFADIMPSKEQMTYIYLSGMGTDSNGKQWWMPIKGATEQYINTLGFKHAFAYRPALMRWAKGQRGTKMQRMQYAYICFYPMMRLCGLANNMTEVAHSMLACTRDGYKQSVINPRDITKLTKQW